MLDGNLELSEGVSLNVNYGHGLGETGRHALTKPLHKKSP